MRHRTGFGRGASLMTAITFLAGLATNGEEAKSASDRFAGFPEIGKYRPGKRSREVITSDGVEGLLRPKWTRAMGDLGGWPAMFRFKRATFLHFPHVDGHRYKRLEATGKILRYVSKDEGKSWTALPPLAGRNAGEFVVAGDRAYRYGFDRKICTTVETSTDGVNWQGRRNVYKGPFWLWGAMYDDVSKTFWAPPHAIPGKGGPGPRQIHLIKSKDGFEWEYVSTVHYNQSESESTLRFEPSRTMVVLIRQKYGRQCWVAVAKPPYQEWDLSRRSVIAEGEHFFEVGGQTFVASRALYGGKDPRVLANRITRPR